MRALFVCTKCVNKMYKLGPDRIIKQKNKNQKNFLKKSKKHLILKEICVIIPRYVMRSGMRTDVR